MKPSVLPSLFPEPSSLNPHILSDNDLKNPDKFFRIEYGLVLVDAVVHPSVIADVIDITDKMGYTWCFNGQKTQLSKEMEKTLDEGLQSLERSFLNKFFPEQAQSKGYDSNLSLSYFFDHYNHGVYFTFPKGKKSGKTLVSEGIKEGCAWIPELNYTDGPDSYRFGEEEMIGVKQIRISLIRKNYSILITSLAHLIRGNVGERCDDNTKLKLLHLEYAKQQDISLVDSLKKITAFPYKS